MSGTVGKWERGRWWRVVSAEGRVWCETSRESEARESMRPGDQLQNLWRYVDEEWRLES